MIIINPTSMIFWICGGFSISLVTRIGLQEAVYLGGMLEQDYPEGWHIFMFGSTRFGIACFAAWCVIMVGVLTGILFAIHNEFRARDFDKKNNGFSIPFLVNIGLLENDVAQARLCTTTGTGPGTGNGTAAAGASTGAITAAGAAVPAISV